MNDKFTVQTYAREYALNSILYKYAKDISFADPNKLSFVKMITMLCKYNGYEPELAERTLDEICKLIESRIENLVSKDGVVSEKDYSDNKLRVLIDLISAQGLQKRFSEKFFDLLPKKVPT
ncbi:MAG: hypothetical protein Hyperionvirus18_41 [Hyperionvirus sp.]|uniref:Uncharacterized protein n=1 Tax=Hyperionvirus sp. TaxID=2487770 RepID=A0A3G5AAB6_9VIRU|nr:MAG: hypothetical protein Hyperionvirus18_41 [Hyperionvirus sp.]